jgi:CubicO group peptidase (beta-lactamase class C family)
LKNLFKWATISMMILAVLVIAHDPLFYKRYFMADRRNGGTDTPLSAYVPREAVQGGNQPPAPRESPVSQSLDATALEAAAEYAGSQQSRALIVSRHGYIVFERYWQGTNYETPIDSAALGRLVAALVTGNAIAEKKIGWPDEPIGNFILEWRDDPRGAITVRNLMQLSSGLAPPVPRDGPGAPAHDLTTRYLGRPLVGTPGKQWVDQSADADLLALVIERATKQRYAQYVSQELWQPIGAADAWLWLDGPGGAVHVDRGFIVHQGDWIRVAELLLQNGNYQGAEVVLPRWVPQLLEPAKSNPNYGAFVHLGAHPQAGVTPYASPDIFVVEGGGNRLWLVPSLQIAILRTGTRLPASVAGAAAWDDARIPNLIIRGARDFVPPAARPGADLSTIVPHH